MKTTEKPLVELEDDVRAALKALTDAYGADAGPQVSDACQQAVTFCRRCRLYIDDYANSRGELSQ